MYIQAAVWLGLVQVCLTCKVLEWRHMEMEEILYRAEIVVHGRDTLRVKVSDDSNSDFFSERTDSFFSVYCVLKNPDTDKPIPTNITLLQVEPRTSCSGTHYEVGHDVILALKRYKNSLTLFEWDEVNVTPDGAAFLAEPGNVPKAMKVCGLTYPVKPVGDDSYVRARCPDTVANATACVTPVAAISGGEKPAAATSGGDKPAAASSGGESVHRWKLVTLLMVLGIVNRV